MSSLFLRAPSATGALAGVSVPLSGLVIEDDPDATATLVLNTGLGALSVDPVSAGLSIGAGSATLWMSGTVAQINDKLGTLSVLSAVAGDAAITARLADGAGRALQADSIGLAVLPLGTDAPLTLPITSGTVSIDSGTLGAVHFDLSAACGAAPALILRDATLGAGATVTLRSADGAASPRLALAGRVENDGAITAEGGAAALSVARGGTLLNEGTMRLAAGAHRVTGDGVLENDGVLEIESGSATVSTAVTGTGTLTVDANAIATISGAVGSGQRISLAAGATLVLTDPASMAATVAAAGADARVVVTGPIDQATLAAMHLVGAAEAGVGTGSGGISFALDVAAPAFAASTLPVFRFFDSRIGTELLTTDQAERATILAARPDLLPEPTGLRAFGADAAGQPDTVSVYRFFDTATGTHFLTADAAERDTLLQTRPDLVFEPGSTMLEHARAQAGDVPVYRFFASATGAHFYTADPAERATILQTRPDMKAEGIAFYAPSA